MSQQSVMSEALTPADTLHLGTSSSSPTAAALAAAAATAGLSALRHCLQKVSARTEPQSITYHTLSCPVASPVTTSLQPQAVCVLFITLTSLRTPSVSVISGPRSRDARLNHHLPLRHRSFRHCCLGVRQTKV